MVKKNFVVIFFLIIFYSTFVYSYEINFLGYDLENKKMIDHRLWAFDKHFQIYDANIWYPVKFSVNKNYDCLIITKIGLSFYYDKKKYKKTWKGLGYSFKIIDQITTNDEDYFLIESAPSHDSYAALDVNTKSKTYIYAYSVKRGLLSVLIYNNGRVIQFWDLKDIVSKLSNIREKSNFILLSEKELIDLNKENLSFDDYFSIVMPGFFEEESKQTKESKNKDTH